MVQQRTLAAMGAITMIVVLLAACSSTGAPAGAATKVIGFSQANGSDEWRTNQNKKVAENCNPVAQTFISDALGDDAVQSTHVDEFASRPVSVLLLTPNTAAGLTEAAKRALAKKIPVITLDRSVDVEVTQHIGADNKLIGKTAAEYVSKTILGGNGGKVIEIQGTAGRLGDDGPPRRVRQVARRERPEGRDRRQRRRRLQARGRPDGDERPAPEARQGRGRRHLHPQRRDGARRRRRPRDRRPGATNSRSSGSTARTRRSRRSRTARSS